MELENYMGPWISYMWHPFHGPWSWIWPKACYVGSTRFLNRTKKNWWWNYAQEKKNMGTTFYIYIGDESEIKN
jgi:hypothetical protein